MDRLPQEIYDDIAAILAESLHTRRQHKGPGRWRPKKARPHHVHVPSLAALATLSRPWQVALEKHMFRHIFLQSTELDTFRALFARVPSRRRTLRRLDYFVLLPKYATGKSEAPLLFERAADRQANNACFTRAMSTLFHILASWEQDDGRTCPRGSLALHLWGVASPDDIVVHGITHRKYADGRRPLGHHRFRYSYLQLLHAGQLPSVSVVGSLSVHVWAGNENHRDKSRMRKLDHRAGLDMMTRLPHLKDVYVTILDTEMHYPALRRLQRSHFVEAVSQALVASPLLDRLALHSFGSEICDHGWPPADLRPLPEAGAGASKTAMDPVSTAIFGATAYHTSLRELDLMGTFDASLFGARPSPSPAAAAVPRPPFWQNLRSLVVHTSMTTPSGHWYFLPPSLDSNADVQAETADDAQMPPGYNRSEEEDKMLAEEFHPGRDRAWERHNVFRVVPDERRIVPFLMAFAQACLQIPGLVRGIVQANIRSRVYRDNRRTSYPQDMWGVSYFAPGGRPETHQQDPAYGLDLNRRRLFWEVKHWQPSEDLKAIFQAIGRDRYGDDLVEKHVNTLETAIKWRYFPQGMTR